MNSLPPKFLLTDREPPRLIQRQYNGRRLTVWEGVVKFDSINGWEGNPRIDLAKRSWQDKVGKRELSQEEIYDLMKSDENVELKVLRDDILKNGLRVPLTLSYDGRLLDGNRRFFAIRFALENLPAASLDRQDLAVLPVFVLLKGTSVEDERNVLVEENFSPSLKKEWPDYVKAEMIVRASEEEKLDIDSIARRFAWDRRKVGETLRINELIKDFEALATEAPDLEDPDGGGFGMTYHEAQSLAADNYQFFNEAQKSLYNQLNHDPDFKIQFFKWIKQNKFRSFPEVRIAYKAWTTPQAREVIMQNTPTAAKEAKAIIDYNERVVKSTGEAVWTIRNFVQFLRQMTVEQINSLPEEAKDELKSGIELVLNMANAASTK